MQAALKCPERLKLCQGLDALPVWGRRQKEGDKLNIKLGGTLIIDAKLGKQVGTSLKLNVRGLHTIKLRSKNGLFVLRDWAESPQWRCPGRKAYRKEHGSRIQ